jgi:hypothetical protein
VGAGNLVWILGEFRMIESIKNSIKNGEMQNRTLSQIGNFIPFIPALSPVAGGVLAAILMNRLDFWFEKYPDGFFKFMDVPEKGHPAFTENSKSWAEELSFSKDEFRSAFDKIGVRYSSKTEFFKKEGDKFQGRLYCSVIDRKSNLTYYFRNHILVDAVLNNLTKMPKKPPKTKAPITKKVGEIEVLDVEKVVTKNQFKKGEDEETGVYLTDKKDAADLQNIIKEKGIDNIKKFVEETPGRIYISVLVKAFYPKNSRGSKITVGKWSGISKKDFTDGSGGKENNYSF